MRRIYLTIRRNERQPQGLFTARIGTQMRQIFIEILNSLYSLIWIYERFDRQSMLSLWGIALDLNENLWFLIQLSKANLLTYSECWCDRYFFKLFLMLEKKFSSWLHGIHSLHSFFTPLSDQNLLELFIMIRKKLEWHQDVIVWNLIVL